MPAPAHKGFFVPNAQDVAKPELAEPDRIDFSIAANARWGVINGCEIFVTGAEATNAAGTAIVNGKLVNVPAGQSIHVGAGGPQDRFDLVGVNQSGQLVRVDGLESLDPVFPDPPITTTVLAAVLCTAGGGDYSANVIDKRKFLADALLTKISSTSPLIDNRNGSGSYYKVDGDGTTSWLGDVTVKRHSAGTLQISEHLRVDLSIWAGGGIQAQSLAATGFITGSNLRRGSSKPADASGQPGEMFQHSIDGSIYVHQDGKWEKMATVKSAIPIGSTITSLQDQAYMASLGWCPLDGVTSILESEYPELVTLLVARGWTYSGTAPNRSVTPLNASKRVFMADFSGTAVGKLGGSTTITIGLANMPPHIHNVDVRPGGAHSPPISIGNAGGHKHRVHGGAHVHNEVPDPGHIHEGADRGDGGGFICAAWGGTNKIDALFNDRSHTWTVDFAQWTRKATTGITHIGSGGSEHDHVVDSGGDHGHPLTVGLVVDHDHAVVETSKGDGAPLAYTPAHLTVYAYIKG